MPLLRLATNLATACHPQPTVAVTTLSTVLLAGAGNPAGTCLLGALAVLTGQLSIGWSNDLIDRGRDVAAGRLDKPMAAGELAASELRTACAIAVLLTVPLSLALGWLPGLVHLVAVAAGWAYNVRLKFTLLSPLPYLVAFGALPVIATTALPEPHLPPWQVVLAAMLIGLAAHFANVLPDLAADLATGVRGLPQAAGFARSAAVAGAAALAATVLLLVQEPGLVTALGLVAVCAVLVVVGWAARARRAGVVFTAIIGCAAIGVALIVATGGLG
ncbi:MAG TPA: UbiA family prenyltransferase [Jatrophihabitans sp.]|nr:UbiA family prenyltransferase [Jatrophihabitans sp.]